MLNLHQLACFVAVAETENVSQAAHRLNISASPLSRQLQALEARLGLTLFERSRQRVWLTEAGRTFLNEARALLVHAARIKAIGEALGRGESAQVAIGYVEAAIHSGVLASAVRRLRVHFPSVGVELHGMRSAQQIIALREREIDCAFLHTPPPADDPDLCCAVVCDDELLLAVPVGDTLAGSEAVTADLLNGRSWITQPRKANPEAHHCFLDACKASGFTPDLRFEADNLLTVLGLVEAGLGIGFVQASLRRIAGPTVVMLPLPWFPLRVAVHLARRRADDRLATAVLCEQILA